MNTKAQSLAKVTQSNKAHLYTIIMNTLLVHPDCSRKQLSDLTGIRLSSICGRVNELLHAGSIEEVGTVFDTESQRNVKCLALCHKAAT